MSDNPSHLPVDQELVELLLSGRESHPLARPSPGWEALLLLGVPTPSGALVEAADAVIRAVEEIYRAHSADRRALNQAIWQSEELGGVLPSPALLDSLLQSGISSLRLIGARGVNGASLQDMASEIANLLLSHVRVLHLQQLEGREPEQIKWLRSFRASVHRSLKKGSRVASRQVMFTSP